MREMVFLDTTNGSRAVGVVSLPRWFVTEQTL
jgi:hypothetical protein